MRENAERKENYEERQDNNSLATKKSQGPFTSSSTAIDNIVSHVL